MTTTISFTSARPMYSHAVNLEEDIWSTASSGVADLATARSVCASRLPQVPMHELLAGPPPSASPRFGHRTRTTPATTSCSNQVKPKVDLLVCAISSFVAVNIQKTHPACVSLFFASAYPAHCHPTQHIAHVRSAALHGCFTIPCRHGQSLWGIA
jgi:hypothetical protein